MGKKHCEVIDVKSSDVSLKPMLLEFEHGTLKKEEVPKLHCDFLINKENPKDIRLILNSEKAAAYKYRGEKLDCDSQLCQRFFVIRNRRTNKVRLASVDQLIVSRYLDNIDKYDKLKSTKIKTINDDQGENLKELSRAFGSKRSQRNLALNNKMKINKDAIGAKMEKTAVGIKLNHVDEIGSKLESGSVFLPKCNRNAKDVNDVYKLEDLFTSSDVFDSLTELAESIINNYPKEPDSEYSKCFIDALKIVPSVTVDKIKCLVFVDALLRFMSLEAKKLNVKSLVYNICPLSKLIRNVIINDFTVFSKSGRTRPLFMRDKAISFVLVLLMIVFDFKLDQLYVKELFGNISFNKLLQIGKLVGFSTVYGANKWMLKVPIPRVSLPKRKSRRPN